MVWVQDAGVGSSFQILDEVKQLPKGKKSKNSQHTAAMLESAMDVHESGDLTRALRAYQQIMGLDPENIQAVTMAGLIHAAQGEHEAAEFLLRRSLAIAPTCVAYNTLGVVLLARRQWDASINCYRSSIALDPTNTSTWPNLLFGLDLHPWATPAIQHAERRAFNELYCRALTESAPPHTNIPDPDRRLKVGYVSGDFKQHSAAHGFGPVVLGHHLDQFEVHLYDVDQAPPNADDQVAAWFREMDGVTFHDVRGYDDATLAATIRTDGMDILVDLSGYSGGGRAMAFARKPAPIQISGFGYATGLGIDAMDYMVGDDVLIPESHEKHYHEKILRVPCFMGYEKAPPWPDIWAAPKKRNGYVTYGYLGRAIKISPQTIAAWGEILTRVPNARMILKSGEYKDETLVAQIRGGLTALGVNPAHLEFRQGSSRLDHLSNYSEVDISLDPFPHGGGVTTVESVLMGTPTITLLGNYVCGRTGASILTTLGFKSAVARTPFEYVKHAVDMADVEWTLEDRRALRARLCGSVLMNDDKYARAVEDEYRRVWIAWCEQQNSVQAPED